VTLGRPFLPIRRFSPVIIIPLFICTHLRFNTVLHQNALLDTGNQASIKHMQYILGR